MELSIYDVIKKVVVTPKSLLLRRKFGKITFEIHHLANKIMVRDAVEKIWNVKVRDVCVINRAGKQKMVGRRSFILPDKKKAIITLKSGYSIDLPDQFETMGIPKAAQGPVHEEAR